MADMYFKVRADYEKVIRLREEIVKLEAQLRAVTKSTPTEEVAKMEHRLSTAREEMTKIATAAAKAGASIGGEFKSRISEARDNIGSLTDKILNQKAAIKDVEADVRRLGEAYRKAAKSNGNDVGAKKAELDAAKKALQEEKAALFGLTQEQARARESLKKLNNEYKDFQSLSEDNADAFGELKDKLMQVGGVIAGGIGVKEFVGKMVQVRGEFQQMETALQTMLGSKEKADELLVKVKEYAKISPLELSSVAGATKMMLGFNIEAEKIPRYLQAIGDVSMGDAGKFNSLTLAFSQMSAAGKLMGQDLLQMVNAGFNPLSVISEQTGKSIGKLREEMSKGAISAEMIQKAFIDATSEGGKFYKMSENASKTINGQLSMMQDAMDAAFNEMGQASEGLIIGSIKAITSIIENYTKVGEIVAGLVATYGVYRAALVSSLVVEQIREKTLLTNIKATKAYAAAQILLNNAIKATPYALVAAAIVSAAVATWNAVNALNAYEAANKRVDNTKKSVEKSLISEISKLKDLEKQLLKTEKGSDEYNKVKQQIVDNYGKYFEGLDDEIEKVGNLSTAYDKLVDAMRNSIGQRQYAAFFNSEQQRLDDLTSKGLEKAYDTLLKEYGKEEGSRLYRVMANAVLGVGEISKKDMDKLTDTDFIDWDKFWTWSGSFSNIGELLEGIKDEQKATEEAFKKYGEMYGMSAEDMSNALKGTTTEASGKEDNEEISRSEWLKSLEKTYNEAQKKVDNFYKEKGKKSKTDWENELKKLKAERDTAKKAYEEAGGFTKSEKKQEEEIDEQEDVAKKFLAEKRQKEQNEKLLSQYQGYLEKRKAIALKYDVDRVNLIFGGASDEAIAENEYQKQRALEAVDNEFAQREDEFNAWANRIINLSVDKLEELLNIAEEELEKLEGTDPDNENLSVARAKVTALRNQIKKEKEKADKDSEEETEKVTTDWKELYKVLTSVKQEFSEIGNIVGGTAGEVLSLAGEMGVFIVSTISSIETLSNAAAEGISKVEKASIILSIISGAMKILTEISNLIGGKFSQYQAYAAKIDEINQLRDAVNDYKMAVIEARHAEENWFAEDNLKNLRDYKEIQQQALKNYKDVLTEAQAIYQNEGGGGWLTDLWKPVTEMIDAAYGKIYGFEINEDYKKGTTEARNNLRIETRKASKGFLGTGIGGKSQKTEDLVAWARNNGLGELFDKDGMINEELAREILDKYGNKLVGQTKATLEALLEYKEQYDAYLEELRNYVSSLYEPLVDNMVDSLWDWLDEGKNALDSFKEYASDTFRDIVSDMMRTIILEKVVGSFSTDIADIYEKYATGQMTEDELAREVANRTQGLVDDYENNMPVLQEILSNIKEYLAAAGIDLNATSATSQEASRRGFGTEMTHEDAGELSGRFSALQIAGEEIKNQSIIQTQSLNLLTMKADNLIAITSSSNYIVDDIRNQIANSYLELVGIRENTSAIVKPIIQMQKDIAEVKENTKNL